jgi:uncharacterized protein
MSTHNNVYNAKFTSESLNSPECTLQWRDTSKAGPQSATTLVVPPPISTAIPDDKHWGVLDESNELWVKPESKTDAWCRTHYGFVNSCAPFVALQVSDEHTEYACSYDDLSDANKQAIPPNYMTNGKNKRTLVTQVTVSYDAQYQYDQAGIMLWRSPSSWIKTSIEYEQKDEPARLGCVVTNHGFSDWSTQDFECHTPSNEETSMARSIQVQLRVEKRGDTVCCFARTLGGSSGFSQTRVAHWAPIDASTDATTQASSCFVGLYACSPIKSGFTAHFSDLSIFWKDEDEE